MQTVSRMSMNIPLPVELFRRVAHGSQWCNQFRYTASGLNITQYAATFTRRHSEFIRKICK